MRAARAHPPINKNPSQICTNSAHLSAGKKGGEFYTPRPVVKLLVTMLDPAENAERELKNKERQLKAQRKAVEFTTETETEIMRLEAEQKSLEERITSGESRIVKHGERDTELKVCKKKIKEIKERKYQLVEEARK